VHAGKRKKKGARTLKEGRGKGRKKKEKGHLQHPALFVSSKRGKRKGGMGGCNITEGGIKRKKKKGPRNSFSFSLPKKGKGEGDKKRGQSQKNVGEKKKGKQVVLLSSATYVT